MLGFQYRAVNFTSSQFLNFTTKNKKTFAATKVRRWANPARKVLYLMKIVPQHIPRINYAPLKAFCAQQRPKVTAKELAGITGYSESAISRWKKAGKPLPGDAIYRFQLRFGLDAQQIAWMFFNGPEPTYSPLPAVIQIPVPALEEFMASIIGGRETA